MNISNNLNLSLQEIKRIRKILLSVDKKEIVAPVRGDYTLLTRIEKYLNAADKPVVDRKPGLFGGFDGPITATNFQATTGLFEAFDAECEELGDHRAAILRELMVSWIHERRKFRALKLKVDNQAQRK